MEERQVEKIIDAYESQKTALISILHGIQGRFGHLPEGALKTVARRLEMDMNDVYGVATFYKAFTLTPQGKHSITLCQGTACHVRGVQKIVREMKALLRIGPGETTEDRNFSLRTVNCLGVCAIGPVMMVDGKFYGEMTPIKARKIIQKLMPKKRNGGRS
jgi:NADH:ubiquinone oxidoreductase subunit E